jgi:tetratricopeptide (TPR) repeat protein
MNPERAAKFRQQAQSLFEKKQYDKALEVVTKALQEHPDNPISWQLQGFIQEACNYRNEAIKSFQEAIKRDESCEIAYVSISRILREKKDFFKSFEILENISQKFPKSALLRQAVMEILEGRISAELTELFKVRPEIIINVLKNAEDDPDFKYKLTGTIKNVAVEKPEFFTGKAFEIIRELSKASDDEVRSTAYVLLVAVYEANPSIIEKNKDVLRAGIADKNQYIQKTTSGILKNLVNYFPNYLVGEEAMLTQALDGPVTAENIMRVLPACPNCHSQDDVYLQPIQENEKILRLYCEKCDVYYFKQPGSMATSVIDKGEKMLDGPVVCPSCKIQFLKWSEEAKLYGCSVCGKWYTQ